MRNDLFAAFSCGNGKRYNLGEAPFQYVAPSADYKGFVNLIDVNGVVDSNSADF